MFDATFKDPDDFRGRSEAPQRLTTTSIVIQDTVHPPQDKVSFLEVDEDDGEDVRNLLESAIASCTTHQQHNNTTPGVEQFDVYKAAVSDSATEKSNKIK